MKKNYSTILKKFVTAIGIVACINTSKADTGLIISEFLANPAGSDSPFEFVELRATKYIDFSQTPYCVVFANNGSATTDGWIAGTTHTYGFNINTGIVNAGDVVYVGGTSMTPTGTHLKVIDTGVNPGDGFGTASSSGVLGNGGANADGIAVFASAITTITASSVPVDAIFFGTGIGSAVVNSGADGYQMPVNDLYSGGKLQATAFFAPDPGSGKNIIATGTYNIISNTFTTSRTWVIDSTVTSGSSLITLSSTTGIESIETAKEVKVYPNPYREQTSIVITLTSEAKVIAEVYNVLGEKLETIANKEFSAGTTIISFSAKQINQPAGIYFIKTTINDKTTVTRIIEQ